MTTEIGRVKCWSSTEGLRQKEVLERETGMVYNVKTTTTTTTTITTTTNHDILCFIILPMTYLFIFLLIVIKPVKMVYFRSFRSFCRALTQRWNGDFFAKNQVLDGWISFSGLGVRTLNNTPCHSDPSFIFCSQFDVRLSVCVCVCLSVRTTFTPIDKPFEDRFRCGKVHKLQCNKPVILHSLVPHSVPASLSWLLICPFSTTLKYNLFNDNYANWRRTGEGKGVQTYMYLVETTRAVVWSQDNPGVSRSRPVCPLLKAFSCPFGHVVVWVDFFDFFTSRRRSAQLWHLRFE